MLVYRNAYNVYALRIYYCTRGEYDVYACTFTAQECNIGGRGGGCVHRVYISREIACIVEKNDDLISSISAAGVVLDTPRAGRRKTCVQLARARLCVCGSKLRGPMPFSVFCPPGGGPFEKPDTKTSRRARASPWKDHCNNMYEGYNNIPVAIRVYYIIYII